MTAPVNLRVEHLIDALGIGVRAPRLSWRLPAGTAGQLAYEIELDGVPQGKVLSADCVLVPWPGDPLQSRQRVAWRVKVWTEAGESEWSQTSTLETGLLFPTDWVASWIEPAEEERPAPGHRPAYVLRRGFEVGEVAPARIYATAHGIYESYLNGERVGDQELTPGFTSYQANLHVQTYDVSELLVRGENLWEVVLSDGWWRGSTGFAQQPDAYGDATAFLGQLHVGEAVVVATDAEWVVGHGPVVKADLMAGQSVDLRRVPQDWRPVRVAEHDLGRLAVSPAPPVRAVEELRPVTVRRVGADRQVVDLGQNINGWLRLRDLGPAGTSLTLTHGEALDAQGDVTQEHLVSFDFETSAPIAVGMVDRVVASGRAGEVFEPRHTVHGFQYVRVEGHPHRLTPEDVTGVVVHTDLRRTGWFACSDDRLNRFHEMTAWSFRDNACDIPTDCPTRERSGWTGDYQLFIPTAAFLFDVAGFSVKWLRDLVADAGDDGCVRNFAPDPLRGRPGAQPHPFWERLQGSSGWGDAIAIVPWELWRAYGDEQVLAECWPAMRAWIDFAAGAARTQRHPSRVARSSSPLPHEAFVWDSGFHWGEWLEPEVTIEGNDGDPSAGLQALREKDNGDVATAFLHHSSRLAATIGRMLGHDADADRLEELAAKTLHAWRTEFIDADGNLTPHTQANHVRALAFGLVPDELRAHTAQRLVDLVRAAGTHLGTGFLATPMLLPVLADTGHLDVAYELLLQDTQPSWLSMVKAGATTVWEDWNGLSEDGTPRASLNHYSKGAVISFLHTHVAGIRLLDDGPAYRHFKVAPQPVPSLTWAEAVHDSPYGRIESAWHRDEDAFTLTVTVPPGTTAQVVMPDGTATTADPGTPTFRCALPR
jgi:alpha-L-rhamnosidase